LILPADTFRIYISGNNGCQTKKPEFNNFKNMKNPDKKIPANLGKNKGSSKFHFEKLLGRTYCICIIENVESST
jgi:hypothetical protein